MIDYGSGLPEILFATLDPRAICPVTDYEGAEELLEKNEIDHVRWVTTFLTTMLRHSKTDQTSVLRAFFFNAIVAGIRKGIDIGIAEPRRVMLGTGDVMMEVGTTKDAPRFQEVAALLFRHKNAIEKYGNPENMLGIPYDVIVYFTTLRAMDIFMQEVVPGLLEAAQKVFGDDSPISQETIDNFQRLIKEFVAQNPPEEKNHDKDDNTGTVPEV